MPEFTNRDRLCSQLRQAWLGLCDGRQIARPVNVRGQDAAGNPVPD